MQEHNSKEFDNELERIKREKLKKMLSLYGGVDMSGELVEINGVEEFEKVVLNSDLPVIVDFWAEWCMPCRMVAPVFKELAIEYAGKMRFAKVNVDYNRELAVRYGVQGIPTLIVFHKGDVIERVVGAMPKPALKQLIDRVLSKI